MTVKSGTSNDRGVKRRKPRRERKEDLIQIRVTTEQRHTLKTAADRAGLDLSSWMRMVGLRAATDENR
jgi:uncharacterized protein (DUF1778 family)